MVERIGIDMTEREIRNRLERWFGVQASDEIVKATATFIKRTPNDRVQMVQALSAFFCIHCGCDTGELSCHCQNDE